MSGPYAIKFQCPTNNCGATVLTVAAFADPDHNQEAMADAEYDEN